MNKKYENSKKIAEYLQKYKSLKDKEKQFTSTLAREAVLKDEVHREEYEKIEEKIKEKKEDFAKSKKELQDSIIHAEELVSSLLHDEYERKIKEGDVDYKSLSYDFSGIASAEYTIEDGFRFEATKEEEEQIKQEIIEKGMYDLLSINEEKLFEFSKKIATENGSHLPCVKEDKKFNTKITVRK